MTKTIPRDSDVFELSELWQRKRVGSEERILSDLILDFSQLTNGLAIGKMLWKKLLSPAPASISKAIRFFEVGNALALHENGHAYLPTDVELETGQLFDRRDGEEFADRQPAEDRANGESAAGQSTECHMLTQTLLDIDYDASDSRAGVIRANASAMPQAPLLSSPMTQAGSSPLPEMDTQAELVIPKPPSPPPSLSTEEPAPRGKKRKRVILKMSEAAPTPGPSARPRVATTRPRVATTPTPGGVTRSKDKAQ